VSKPALSSCPRMRPRWSESRSDTFHSHQRVKHDSSAVTEEVRVAWRRHLEQPPYLGLGCISPSRAAAISRLYLG